MLADALEGVRGRLVDELARRVALVAPPSPVPAARRARLDRDVTQAIEALRHSGSIASITSSAIADPKRELDDHAMVEVFLLEQAAKEGQRTRATERALAQWRCAADRRCLHEQNRRLAMLLDEVNEGAAVLAPDGRILYCNMALGWASTSSGKSCSPTAATFRSTRRPKTARRSRCACRAASPA